MNTFSADQLRPLFAGATWATFVWHSHNGGLIIQTNQGSVKVPGGKRGRGDDECMTFGTYKDGDFPRSPKEVEQDLRIFNTIQAALADPRFTRAVFNVTGFSYFRKKAS